MAVGTADAVVGAGAAGAAVAASAPSMDAGREAFER